MNSRTTRSFWKKFHALPTDVRDQAQKAYRLWRDDTAHFLNRMGGETTVRGGK